MPVRIPKRLLFLDILAILSMLGTFLFIVYATPLEITMGLVQKLFYFHVASAWVGMLGFLTAATAGIFYLMKRKSNYDAIGVAAVEIGLVFSICAILSGMIWAKPAWNTWWTWDPRLTTTAIMVLIFSAYLLLRGQLEEVEKRARFAAIYAIIGAASVPITFFSIRFFRTIHPVIIGSNEYGSLGGFAGDAGMLTAFILSIMTFSILFAALLWHRTLLEKLNQLLDPEMMTIEGEK